MTRKDCRNSGASPLPARADDASTSVVGGEAHQVAHQDGVPDTAGCQGRGFL